MILDQRQMYGATTVDEVRERWQQILDQINQQRVAARQPLLELVDDDRTVAAYVNHSRWVADCPDCRGGIACWDENPRGACLDCGHVYKVAFPPAKQRTPAEATLLQRTFPRHRNWHPGTEDVKTLRAETKLLDGVIN